MHRSLNALIVSLIIGCSAAYADSSSVTTSAPVVLVTPAPAQVAKPSFAAKHPKFHKAGRKMRHACVVLLPVVQFVGGVAQILFLFK